MITCQTCGYEGLPKIVRRTDGVHHADKRCPECGRHCGFVPKPQDDPTKYKRPTSHKSLVDKYSRGFCEMCLTEKKDLPKNQTLEAHHVMEYQDGGEATRDNTWIVCTGCHRLITWRRTYTVIEKVAEAVTSWMD